jgi:orotate phosphoribosyltransferase/AMMECR1 domain-containing protein
LTTAIALRTDREELLQSLLEHGILRRSDAQPILSRDGSSARWMLNSLAVTLTPRGAELAGRLILERLRSFDGRQIATYGLTAVPILQSAVLQSGGRYHGLLVRKERKAHGSLKLIEGRIDPDEPTILIDDSIASGMSMNEGIRTLEAAGLRVEGCLALVRFGWDGGCSMLRERGYPVETVYDIFEDFMSRMEDEPGPDYNPTKTFPEFRWRAQQAPDGLHPAHLAREVVREYLSTGELLRPPTRLDRSAYDSSGGAWVSVRSRADIFERHARSGFWHFPDERSWGPAEDVVRAALLTGCELPAGAEGLKLLDESHIAVTFFSALERARLGALDNNRYGIVVVSGERPEIMGGALPAMPGIRDEWQQFRHARYNNAGLLAHEPYIIYRHGVEKFVEPGAPWQPSGAPSNDQVPDCGALAARAREFAMGREPAGSIEDTPLPANAKSMFVTVFIDGDVRGCMGADLDDSDHNLRSLTEAALADERFEHVAMDADSPIAVSVSVLYNELDMGDFSREEVPLRYRNGQQALMVEQNAREGLLLPCVATWLCLDGEDFVSEVLDKAGVTRPPYNWRRFDCATWLADEDGIARLDGAFKRAAPIASLSEIARLHLDYLLRNRLPDGSFYFDYYPFENTRYRGIDAARLAHAAWTLARAAQPEAALSAWKCAASEDDDTLAIARDAFLLLALCEPGMFSREDATALAAKLWATIDRHGRIETWRPSPVDAEHEDDEDQETTDPEELQNYFPGQVLLALAAAARTGAAPADERKLERAFRYYRHRFRYRRDFGQVSWMMLASAAWRRITRNREFAELVFEIGDWILEFQSEQTGAFLTDHQPDTPGYTTAVYLEGIAAGATAAAEAGDPARHARYLEAYRRGFAFLDRIIIQQRDSSVLPNADYAIGGLRENLYSSHVRIDFVQHSLAAILELNPDALVTTHSGESDGR